MRIWLLLAMLLTGALAGCTQGGDGDKESSETSGTASSTGPSKSTSSTRTGTSSSGTSTAPRANQAPTGSLAAEVVNGSVPLQVNFTLNGTDADGDKLTWVLAFGDNSTNATGSTLPATPSHNFTSAGNFTVRFEVSDGQLANAYNVTIKVLASGGAAITAVFTEGQAIPSNPVNSAMIPNVGYAGGTGCAGYWDGSSGFDCVFFVLEAAWAGKMFTATANKGNPDLEFWPVCDPAEVFAVEGFAVAGPESGAIPAGALCVVIWNGAASADTPIHTFTVL